MQLSLLTHTQEVRARKLSIPGWKGISEKGEKSYEIDFRFFRIEL